MRCDTLVETGPDGKPKVYGFVCGAGRPPKPCVGCGRRGEVLCDGPAPGGKTCDAWICRSCAKRPKANVDYCPRCAGELGYVPATRLRAAPPPDQPDLFWEGR